MNTSWQIGGILGLRGLSACRGFVSHARFAFNAGRLGFPVGWTETTVLPIRFRTNFQEPVRRICCPREGVHRGLIPRRPLPHSNPNHPRSATLIWRCIDSVPSREFMQYVYRYSLHIEFGQRGVL